MSQSSTNPKQAAAGLGVLVVILSGFKATLAWTGLNWNCNSHQVALAWHIQQPVLAWNVPLIKWPQAWHKGQLASVHSTAS